MTHLAGINVEGTVLSRKTSRQFAATQHFGRSEANTDKPRLQRKRIYEYTSLSSTTIGDTAKWRPRHKVGDPTLLTHLRHHRAILAVMHNGLLARWCGNVGPGPEEGRAP